MNKDILGIWRIDPADVDAYEAYGEVSMEFKETGELIYTIHLPDREQKILMTYEIAENKLITDQASAPNKEETEYRIFNGTLELYFGGTKSTYKKSK